MFLEESFKRNMEGQRGMLYVILYTPLGWILMKIVGIMRVTFGVPHRSIMG